MRLFVVTVIAALVGFTSTEALVRIAIDEERSSHLQELVVRLALGGLTGSVVFFTGLLLWFRYSRRKTPRAR